MAYGDGQNGITKLSAVAGSILIVGLMGLGLHTTGQITPSPPKGPQWITANGSAEGGITTVDYKWPEAPAMTVADQLEPQAIATGYEYHVPIDRGLPLGAIALQDQTDNGKLKVLQFRQLPARNIVATATLFQSPFAVELPEGSYIVQIAQGYGYNPETRMPASGITINEGSPVRVTARHIVSIDLSSQEGNAIKRITSAEFHNER